MKNSNASELGKLSAKKRLLNSTKEQRSAYMKLVRAGKTPTILPIDKNERL